MGPQPKANSQRPSRIPQHSGATAANTPSAVRGQRRHVPPEVLPHKIRAVTWLLF